MQNSTWGGGRQVEAPKQDVGGIPGGGEEGGSRPRGGGGVGWGGRPI